MFPFQDPSEKVVLKTKDEAAKGAEAWDKTKGSVKETANESGAKLKSAVDKVKDHAHREIDTSRDMVRFTHHHIVVTVGDKQVWHKLFQILRKVPLVTFQSIRTSTNTHASPQKIIVSSPKC